MKIIYKIATVVVLLFLECGGIVAQTLTLQQCRDMALRHDEDLRSADIAVRQAELERKTAFARNLPQVDASATSIYRNDIAIRNLELQMRGALLAGITVTQPIYQGGKITAAHRLARIGEQASHEQVRKVRAELIYEVTRAYYTLMGVSERVKMLESYQRQMQQLKSDVQISVENGLLLKNDLMTVENEQSQVELQLLKARNGEQICQWVLADLIGTDGNTPLCLADTFSIADTSATPSAPTAVSAAGISTRPELALLKYRVEAAQQQVKLARAGMLPTLGLQFGYSGFTNVKLKGQLPTLTGDKVDLNQNLHKSSPQVALALNVPVFHWGTEWRNTRKAKMDVERAQLELDKQQHRMTIELQQAALNLTTSDEMVLTARKGLRQAEENLRIHRQRYSVKTTTLSDLLDAESRWRTSYTSLIEALTQQRISQTDYQRAAGVLD